MPNSNVVRLPNAPALSWDDCRLLVESVLDYAIFILDTDGHVITWNPGAEKIKGYRAEEVVGRHFSLFFTPEDVAAGKPQRELETARDVGRFETEGWRVRKDGSRFWASVVLTALRDEAGRLRGYGKVTRDLTIRRAAEEELRQSEQRFHHLVDAVVDYAIFMLDPEGHVATWNAGASRLKGYAATDIIGRHFSTFYPPGDRAAERPQRLLDIVRRQGRVEDEGWRVRNDGSRFWANVSISALRDPSGTLLGFAKVTRDLTERRLAEERLRKSEERFRLLIENVGDYAIYMLDPSGRVTTWNRGAERMKGYASAEIIGQSFARFFPEEDVARGKPGKELAVALTQGRFEDEGWRVRKDGTRFWANAILNPLYDAEGKLLGFAKITRDLTHRRETEAKDRKLLREQVAREAAEHSERLLQESELRYRVLSQRLEVVLEGVADGITVQDREGNVLFANTAAARIFGFKSGAELIEGLPAEVLARFDTLDIDGRPLDVHTLPFGRVFAGEEAESVLTHVRERATGRDWWFRIRASAVLDESGHPELAINIWHDVTADLRREFHSKYLADATAALGGSLVQDDMLGTLARLLVPGLGDWCTVLVLEGEHLREVAVAHVDPSKADAASAYTKRFPQDPSDPAGAWAVIRSGRAAVYNDITDDLLAGAARDPEALAILRSVGMTAVLLVPIRVRDRTLGVLAFVSSQAGHRYDDSLVALAEELGRRTGVALENTQLYAAAQEAARRAEAAAKAAEEASRAKDEFLATVSHELRTPLTAIVGWASILKDRANTPGLEKPIEIIHRNAHAQVKIIDDILDVSRVITGTLRIDAKPADLVAIAREALEVVRPSAIAKKITLSLRTGCEDGILVADPERLQQVVWNLLSNAVKFTNSGGAVEVSVDQEGSSLVLAVRDSGNGIAPDFLPFVFDRFRQADSTITRRVGGLGLGLALVRHIVELHGGHVTAASEGLGKGSTFTITLPVRAVASASPSGAPDPSATASKGVLHGVVVLVVDDELDARDLVETVLADAGAIVETASSADEGFEAFMRKRPAILISDIGMPDQDGFSLIRRIRALRASDGGTTPALALTAFTREEDRVRSLRAGYTTHIGKPVNPAGLVAAVVNLVMVNRAS